MQRQRYREIAVECYAGYRAEQEPRRFRPPAAGDGDRRAIGVVEILDRWLDPRHRYFKVLGEDGRVYLLRHDEGSGHWGLLVPDPPRCAD